MLINLPLSERAIQNMVVMLQKITVVNGYQTDAGYNVFRARHSVDTQDLPCIVVWEGRESPQNNTGKAIRFDMSLDMSIEGYVVADRDETGTQLGLIKADIKKALAAGDASGKRKGAVPDPPNDPFAHITYVGSQPIPRADSTNFEGVSLTFALEYGEKNGDPYSSS